MTSGIEAISYGRFETFMISTVSYRTQTTATRKLSRTSGPIVRITPHELHIRDSEYYDEIYAASSKKRDKWSGSVVMAGAPGSILATVGHDLHRLRRGVLNPFFSKRVIASKEVEIREKIERLCRRFEMASESGEVLRVDVAYSALVSYLG
jgi:cytochrome P450